VTDGARIRILQIYYDARTRGLVDPGFEPLDNSPNERPDWYEYWPIRAFLRSATLADADYYGFLSPRFAAKTGLAGERVKEFIDRAGDADVVTFSPFPEHSACFLNLFEQGEVFHPGLGALAARFCASLDPGLRLDRLVTHSRNAVLANYFVARPRFWRRWHAVLEHCFGLAETPGALLHAELNATTVHHGQAKPQMKIFLLERAASLLLASSPTYAVASFPPFEMAFSHPYFTRVFSEVIELDALKLAFAGTGDAHYLKCYRALQDRVLRAPDCPWRELWAARPGGAAAG
jgi:hypothetical protein